LEKEESWTSCPPLSAPLDSEFETREKLTSSNERVTDRVLQAYLKNWYIRLIVTNVHLKITKT